MVAEISGPRVTFESRLLHIHVCFRACLQTVFCGCFDIGTTGGIPAPDIGHQSFQRAAAASPIQAGVHPSTTVKKARHGSRSNPGCARAVLGPRSLPSPVVVYCSHTVVVRSLLSACERVSPPANAPPRFFDGGARKAGALRASNVRVVEDRVAHINLPRCRGGKMSAAAEAKEPRFQRGSYSNHKECWQYTMADPSRAN